ncbi:MAG: helix-turn-helix domain-containing protein, partial [Bacillota bacterium]
EDSEKACEAYGGYTDKKIIFYDNLGIYKIFCHDALKEELNDFYNQKLKGLIAYDNKKETNLIETLDMYFEENGNLKKMSEKLYTHYNTILYRMKRIQEILDVDIKDRKVRYNLETALEIYKIMKKNNN